MRHEMSSSYLVAATVAVSFAGGACRADIRTPVSSPPEIALRAPASAADRAAVEVKGLSADDLSRLRNARLGPDEWQSLLAITVVHSGTQDPPPVQGGYAVTDNGVEFVPLLPFDLGREYHVAFDPASLRSASLAAAKASTIISLPSEATAPTTFVTAIHPSADVVPENLLRMYIEFSGPMGNGTAREFVRLRDQAGEEVPIPFLPVDAGFWNPNHTRYALVFDPGRVKQGIRPNRELGRPLRAGRRYVLDVSAGWRDANGLPLEKAHRHEFRVGPPEGRAIMLSPWRIAAPTSGNRDPLVVSFPRPLDRGLLVLALAVETKDRRPFDGDATVEANGTRWRFTPAKLWQRGEYALVASSMLEDPAGNRIGRPFDAGPRSPEDDRTPGEYRVPFSVADAR